MTPQYSVGVVWEGVVNPLTDFSLYYPIDSPLAVLQGLIKLCHVRSTMSEVERLGVVIVDGRGPDDDIRLSSSVNVESASIFG